MLWGYEQATFPYPAKPSQMGRQLMGKNPADALIDETLGCRDRVGGIPHSLDHPTEVRSDQVEALIDDVVCMMSIVDGDGTVRTLGQLIDDGMGQCETHRNGAGVGGDFETALFRHEFFCLTQIRDAEEIDTKAGCRSLQTLARG
jgi:hypothetical protein